MNLKEMLEAKLAELNELKSQIEAGDAEAIEKGAALSVDIEKLEDSIAKAEKANGILARVGKKSEKAEEKTGVAAVDFSSLIGQKGAVSFDFKAYNDTHTSTQVATTSQNVVDVRPALNVRALFGSERISGNALTYFVLGATEGTIGATNEGAKKNQVHTPYDKKTVALIKVTAFIKETDELLADNAFLESALRSRLVYEFEKAIEAYLVSELINTEGVQVGADAISFDAILAAKQDIIADTGYTPDAILINPADWATLLQSKDSNNQYLLGGPAFGAYGNGGYFANPKVWGMNVVESAAVPEGQLVLGAFKAAASIASKAGEAQRVEVSNSNEDDFIYNLLTLRIEERLVEIVRVPAAFALVGTAQES